MHVISKKKLRKFWERHPAAKGLMEDWHKIAKHAEWESFDDVRAAFGRRFDRVGRFVIFDVGGNKYRLIAVIHYNRQKVFLRHVLTHAEYDRNNWKDD